MGTSIIITVTVILEMKEEMLNEIKSGAYITTEKKGGMFHAR